MFRMPRLGLMAAACLSGGVAWAAGEATPATPMTIYDTALAPGWENWSWARTELSVELSGSPRKPIRVEAAGWQALYLHHAPFSTAGLKKISLLIQGSVPEADVKLIALIDGKAVGEGKIIKVTNKGWTKVVTPLATLGVEDQTIDGIWVQNASASELPKFFVTDIVID